MTTLGTTHRDSERAEIITRWLDRDRRRASDYADNALDLQRLRDSFIGELGEREGRATFAAFAAEHLSLGQSPRSKMLTVADYLGDLLRDLPATYQYHASRAIKQGADLDDVCADAVSMPMRDFLERYELVKPRKPKPAEPSRQEDALLALWRVAECCPLCCNDPAVDAAYAALTPSGGDSDADL